MKAQIGLDDFIDVDEFQLEELIIIKAMKDFNCSKFASENLTNIEAIINDIFQNKSNPNCKPSEYSTLQDLVKASFETKKLDYNAQLETKAFQLYEIVNVKQGCIILGQVMSGKTTLISLLAAALNRASQNELKLRIAEKRKEKFMELALKHKTSQLQVESLDKKKSKRLNADGTGMGVSFNTTGQGPPAAMVQR